MSICQKRGYGKEEADAIVTRQINAGRLSVSPGKLDVASSVSPGVSSLCGFSNPAMEGGMFINTGFKQIRRVISSYKPTGWVSVEELLSMYNGKIDIFLFATAFFAFIKAPYNQKISKNDYNDIFHLSYITENNLIISDDRIFIKLLDEFF